MQLPNKLYSYQKSTLSLIPRVLKEVNKGTTNVIELFHAINPKLEDPSDFLSVMDLLYALNAIEISDEGEVIKCL
ncbi:ABC-three component system middle component 7 [Peptoniphilus lacydonensis]|uniref:ABC-three component system middle component 7 n=1 Tax=Peptoniphilus lacydonensis TaxID=1673725 RepID=UPI0008DA30DC|nr:ABC-three component system middle component 7 [Peptoniphilus lacydonensis]